MKMRSWEQHGASVKMRSWEQHGASVKMRSWEQHGATTPPALHIIKFYLIILTRRPSDLQNTKVEG